MDKKLLDSLNNLSLALEDIADILAKKQSTSATGAALESGDFSKDLKQINTGIISIKKDTQEILKGQKTILEMSKKRDSSTSKKTPMEDVGGDPKQESKLKKGLGTILLIAVAVLAIGMAFKLVGKIDFLSVIGLGLAILVISVAFQKVAMLNLTVKQAAIASLAMVLMSIAVTMSSWALSMIKPIGFSQAITGILIAGLFTVLAFGLPKIVKALNAVKNPVKMALLVVMMLPALALGIAMASWALAMIKPIGFAQAVTGILIAGMFTVLAFGLPKIVKALNKVNNPVKMALLIPLMLPVMAAAIAASSYVLQLVKPIGFAQAITAILIAALFVVLSFGIEKIVKALGRMKWADVAKMPVFFTLLAGAIAASAFIFAKAAPYFAEITFMMMLKVLILGVAMGVVLVIVAFAMKIMGTLKWGDVIKVPALFTLLALAIAASAFIIFKASGYINGITFMTMFKLLVFSIVLAIAIVILAIAMKIVNLLGNVASYVKGGLAVVIIATTIMVASLILNYGTYKKYPDWKWSLGVGMSLVAFGLAAVVLGGIAMSGLGALAILAGCGMILAVAATVVATSYILNKGKYDKYPSAIWVIATAAAMLPFGMAALALGMIAVTGIGAIAIALGLISILAIAKTIVETAKILAKGKYDKAPPITWTLQVAAAMLPFGMAAVALGMISITGIGAIAIAAGLIAVLLIAKTIVETSKILSKGKYSGGPPLWWSLSTGLVMTGFGLAVLTLGTFIVGTLGLGWLALEAGAEAVSLIAQSIVDASIILQKGKYTGGPTKEWAEGISIALGAFSPIYGMMMSSGIMEIFGGGGVSPAAFSEAIVTVSEGIITAAGFFAANSAAFVDGPSKKWADGVGTAIGAFAPVYSMLVDFPFTGGKKMSAAIVTISKGIVASADIFAKNKATFDEGYPSKKWGAGVGAAIGAFAPVFKALHEDTGWFTSGDEVVNNMSKAIKAISWALVTSAKMFSGVKKEAWDSYPSSTWSNGVGESISGFVDVYKSLSENEIDVNDLSLVSKYAGQMAKTAAILGRNKKYFDIQIDPNFVKKMSKNIVDYTGLVKKLSSSSTSSFASMLGIDPIQNIANGMVKIAGAYDKLAKAIKSFSSSLNGLDPVKVSSFTRLTGNIAMLSALDSSMFSNMLKVLESKSSVFAKMLDQQAKSEGLGKKGVKGPGGSAGGAIQSKKGDEHGQPKDAKGQTQLQKLDMMIELLTSMNTVIGSGFTLDLYLQEKGSAASAPIGKEK